MAKKRNTGKKNGVVSGVRYSWRAAARRFNGRKLFELKRYNRATAVPRIY